MSISWFRTTLSEIPISGLRYYAVEAILVSGTLELISQVASIKRRGFSSVFYESAAVKPAEKIGDSLPGVKRGGPVARLTGSGPVRAVRSESLAGASTITEASWKSQSREAVRMILLHILFQETNHASGKQRTNTNGSVNPAHQITRSAPLTTIQ